MYAGGLCFKILSVMRAILNCELLKIKYKFKLTEF